MPTLYVYEADTLAAVEEVSGGTRQEQFDYVEARYSPEEYAWTYTPAFGARDGLVLVANIKHTRLEGAE